MSETESFESVASSYGDFTWIGRDGVKAAIDRLKAAHDREIRDTAQQQYDRGFNDGEHSMDAEHRAIAMRLRQLPLDGGSHENLSQIARAIYHSDWGWTQGACAALRDELVRLMGGVSDDCCCAGGGACAAGDGRDSGEQEVSDGRVADDSGADTGCGDGGGDLHMDGLVTYDVLDNERRKAVCELRYIRDCLKGDSTCNSLNIADAIGAKLDVGDRLHESICDRLIHLLGGDHPSGIDVLRAMEEREAEGGITDELRNLPHVNSVTYGGEELGCAEEIIVVTRVDINRIADRIDEQFARVCEQQEAVLQETIDGMVGDRESDQQRIEKLVKQRDAAYARTDELSDELLRVRRERDEARDECDRLKRDMLDEWVPRTSYEEKVEKYRRAYMESDAWRKSLQEKLNAMRDAITAALNG